MQIRVLRASEAVFNESGVLAMLTSCCVLIWSGVSDCATPAHHSKIASASGHQLLTFKSLFQALGGTVGSCRNVRVERVCVSVVAKGIVFNATHTESQAGQQNGCNETQWPTFLEEANRRLGCCRGR